MKEEEIEKKIVKILAPVPTGVIVYKESREVEVTTRKVTFTQIEAIKTFLMADEVLISGGSDLMGMPSGDWAVLIFKGVRL